MAAFKNNGKLKLLIIVGTRPEIIRLAAVINKARQYNAARKIEMLTLKAARACYFAVCYLNICFYKFKILVTYCCVL